MKILVSLSFALTTALGFYVFDLRADLAAARSHVDIARESERQALEKVQPLQRNLERLTAEQIHPNSGPEASTPADHSATPTEQKEEASPLSGLGKLFAMPEMKSTLRRQALVETRNNCSALLKSWNLSKSDEELFVQMVADLESVGMEAAFSLLGGKGNADDALDKAEAAEEETKTRLKSLLGEARYAEWEKAEAARNAQEATASFKEYLTTAGLKLPEAQEAQLLTLVQAERRSAGLDNDANKNDIKAISDVFSEATIAAEFKKTKTYQAKVREKAIAFLNPDQVNALQTAFEEETSNLKMGMELMRTFLPAGKPAAPAQTK